MRIKIITVVILLQFIIDSDFCVDDYNDIHEPVLLFHGAKLLVKPRKVRAEVTNSKRNNNNS